MLKKAGLIFSMLFMLVSCNPQESSSPKNDDALSVLQSKKEQLVLDLSGKEYYTLDNNTKNIASDDVELTLNSSNKLTYRLCGSDAKLETALSLYMEVNEADLKVILDDKFDDSVIMAIEYNKNDEVVHWDVFRNVIKEGEFVPKKVVRLKYYIHASTGNYEKLSGDISDLLYDTFYQNEFIESAIVSEKGVFSSNDGIIMTCDEGTESKLTITFDKFFVRELRMEIDDYYCSKQYYYRINGTEYDKESEKTFMVEGSQLEIKVPNKKTDYKFNTIFIKSFELYGYLS